MAKHREFLDLGLWTAPDPALLEPGQLASMRNATYFPGTKALTRATGRIVFGTVTASATDVNGLRDIQFDNGDQLLIAMTSGVYSTAYVSGAGAFAVMVSALPSGTSLEAVHFRNRFYLFNGATAEASAIGSNKVVYLSATSANLAPTVRQHGMLPVSGTPGYTTAAGSFSQSVSGYYEYWTTEVAKFPQDGAEFIMESTFVGTPATVFVSSTGVVPTIEQPELRNLPLTTHWRVYRSPKKDREADKKFPTGFMIGEMASATGTQPGTFADTLTVSNTGLKSPTTYNTSLPYNQFANRSNLGAADLAYASATVPVLPATQAQGAYGFNFGGFVGNIRGIEVEVKAYVSVGSAPVPFKVTIGKRGANGDFDSPVPLVGGTFARTGAAMGTVTAGVAAAGAPQTILLGSPTNRWIPSDQPGFVDSDFGADFMAVLSVSKPNVSVGFDSVKINVYYGASVDSTVVFPTVVYTFGDVIAQVGKNGTPPSSNTGDLFEDCLVVNDTTNPGLIRYSFPGDTEAFPSTYFIDFQTRENDRVRLIKVVNSRLIVGLDSSIWRINYLPSERDASFDRGKAKEAVSRTYGIVNPMCACIFSTNGSTEILAGVSNQGIFGTDGYDVTFYTDGLDWRQIIPTSGATPIALVNDPENYRLIFLYRNDSNGNESYLALHLNYDDEHMVDGKPKVSGPIHMRNFAAGSSSRANPASIWVAPKSNGDRAVFIGYGSATAAGGGQVYVESGTTIPAENATMGYTTRRMYLADFGNEWRLNNLWGHVGSANSTPTIQYSTFTNKTNDAGASAGPAKSITLAGQKLHKVPFALMSEGISIAASITASAFGQEFIVLDGDNFGEEDAGRT